MCAEVREMYIKNGLVVKIHKIDKLYLSLYIYNMLIVIIVENPVYLFSAHRHYLEQRVRSHMPMPRTCHFKLHKTI